jgi:hypothetical protein
VEFQKSGRAAEKNQDGSDGLTSYQLNHRCDLCDEVSQQAIDSGAVNSGHSRLVLNRDYQLKVEIVAHVRRRTVSNDRRDLCVVVQFAAMDDHGGALTGNQIPNVAKLCTGRLSQYDLQQPMLVHVIEIADEFKERRMFWVRSMVRLYSLDCCLHSVTQRSDSPLATGELFRTAGDGKSQLVGSRRGRSPRFTNCNRVDRMIQSAPKVMDAISGEQRPSLDAGRIQHPQEEGMSGVIGVCLLDGCVRVTLHPGANLILDGLKVFTSPSDLGFSTG